MVDRNAKTVIATGRAHGVSARGIQIALAVILAESNGYNLASQAVPESLRYPHDLDVTAHPPDGVPPGDHKSINLFQQQVGMGWFPTVEQGMKVDVAAAAFFTRLLAVNGWEDMPFALAAQSVQRSAFPARYGMHELEATALYSRLSGDVATIVPATDTSGGCQEPNLGDSVTPAGSGAVVVSGRWANPLAPTPYTDTSPMGWRVLRGVANYHKGQDLAVDVGAPVYSVCDGVVIGSGWDPFGGGNMLTLDCGGDVIVKLMHNSKLLVKVNAPVKAGQLATLSGNTGNSTGPHLHVQVEFKGSPVEPVRFFGERGIRL